MIKLKNLITEVQTPISIVFTKESDYKSFKDFIKTEDDEKDWTSSIIQKDLGKSKYSSDTGGWYLNVRPREMDNFFGKAWFKSIKEDWPSIIIS